MNSYQEYYYPETYQGYTVSDYYYDYNAEEEEWNDSYWDNSEYLYERLPWEEDYLDYE
jgi:hypothetical protein